MTTHRFSPYVILGLDYGATEAEARLAFSQRARRLRHQPNEPFSLEDLTWALREAELLAENPNDSVAYFRVPAHRAAPPPDPGTGLLRPRPIPLRRQTDPPSDEDRRTLAQLAARELAREWLAQLEPDRNFDPYGDDWKEPT